MSLTAVVMCTYLTVLFYFQFDLSFRRRRVSYVSLQHGFIGLLNDSY